MGPRDIEALVGVGRPTIAPDGSFAVFATARPDVEANRSVGQLWRVDLPDGIPRRLTRGVADVSPRLSPDGALLAFLRSDARGHTQIFVVAAAGGEAVQATDAPADVTEYAWSPDGRDFAYIARVPEPGRYGSVAGLDAAAEAPRRVSGVRWHSNGLGYTADRPARLFAIAVPDPGGEPTYAAAARMQPRGEIPPSRAISAEARALTDGAASWHGTTWTADGREILAVPDVIEAFERDLRDRVVAVAVDGSGSREVIGTNAGLSIDEVAVAADGAVLILAAEVGDAGRDFIAPGTGLWIADGRGGARPVTDTETIDLGEPGSALTADGDTVLVQHRARGRVRLLRIGRDGAATELLGGDVEVTGVATAAGIVVAAVATPDSFAELALISGGEARALTRFGADARARGVVRPREMEATARDGYPLHGWVATPEGEGPFPVILLIHGGPFAQYGVGLFDEVQVLVGAGYAVVYGNPRGSAGYGRAHGRAIRRAMGTIDFTDVLDLLDSAVGSDDRLDGDRVGVQGGSYGGFLTAWTIAHDHRFAGAIVERGFLDPESFRGTSDIGSFFGDEYVGVDPVDIARQSPMAVADRVRTPTLVMHSELDFRCPLEQATRYYTALKRGGVDTEMLLFPGENHELSRAGQPRHRVERFDAILQWWRRWLPIRP